MKRFVIYALMSGCIIGFYSQRIYAMEVPEERVSLLADDSLVQEIPKISAPPYVAPKPVTMENESSSSSSCSLCNKQCLSKCGQAGFVTVMVVLFITSVCICNR